jgi:hypothetical protein
MAEQDPITSSHRVSALRRTGLLDSPPEEVFDQLARLAASATSAPIALVSLVDEDRQYFKSAVGELTGPMSAEQETPLSYSLCVTPLPPPLRSCCPTPAPTRSSAHTLRCRARG